MSNVLIGIIGVILFIGLALAGALFLGPRFQQATAESTASKYMAAVAQVAAGTDMMSLQSGRADFSQGFQVGLVDAGFIKTRPYIDGTPVEWLNTDNTSPTASDQVAYVVMRQTSSTFQQTVCKAVNRSMGRPSDTVPQAVAPPSDRAGCFQLSAAWGRDPATMIIYYQRVS